MTRVVRGVLQSGRVPAGEQWGFWCEVLRQGRYGATADDWSGFVSFFDAVIAAEGNGGVDGRFVDRWVCSREKGE